MIENKTKMIFALVKPSDKLKIDDLANKKQMRTSEFVRQVVLSNVKQNQIDDEKMSFDLP